MIKKSGLFTFLLTAVFAVNANAISSETNGVETLPNLAMSTKSDGQNLNTQSSVSDFFKLDNELAIEGNGVIPAKLPTEIKSVSENNVTGTDKTAVTDLDKHKTPKFTDNGKTTAKSATAVLSAPKNTVTKNKQDLKKPDLPLIKENLQEMIVPLDQASLSKEQGNKTENSESNIKCSSKLPCIPMFNRYVLKLDENDAVKPEKEPNLQISKANQPKFESDKIYTNLATKALPSLGQVRFNNIPLDKEILTKKPVSKDPHANKAVFKPSYLSESPLVAKLFEQGVIIGDITPQRPKIEKNEDDPESLKNKSTDELIDEQQRLYKLLGVTGNFVRSYSEAEDKAEFIKSLGLSKVNGVLDSQINEYLKAYDGVNAEISSRLSVSKGNWKLQPEGKLLVPLWSKPKSFTYMQTGLTTGTSDRKIAHLGIGERIYPQAKSMEDLGHHMLGFNAVVDKDLSRGHTRGSIGLEYMHDNLKLLSNIYRRLSSWKDSPDFEKGYVQERPASGWDFFAEYWFKAKLALKAGVTHWIGRDISPFGDTNEKNLENDPYIYEAGIKYTPVPAISLEAKHQHTNHGNNNSYIGINFNIPLGDNFSFENAFNPDAVNKAQGNNIMTSRSMFIERDYTMPLQYRSKPGMYYITFMGALGNNRYQFKIEDGFKRAAPNLPVYVKAKHPSVKLSNNGNYITNIAGMFVVEVTHSAVRNTTLTVIAGSVANDFNITIDKVDLLIKASKTKFVRFEESLITLYADAEVDGLEGTKVSFRIADGAPGSLVDAEHTLNASGQATVIYRPDETKTSNYDVKVIGTVFDIDFPITLHVVIYGNDADSFSVAPKVIDGGQYATITYTNLKPHSILTVSATGKCNLTDTKPEKALETKATGDTPVKLELEADDEGSVVAYAVGATDIGATGSCLIETKTQDPYFPAPKAEIQNQVYDPAWELPASVLYLEAFPAKLKNLKNTTEVDFSIGNDSADLEFSKTVKNLEKQQAQPGVALMRLAVSPNNSGAVKKVIVENKQASADYMVTGDYSVRDVEGIKAVYYHDAFNTQAETTASVLAIQQFTPVFVMNDEDQAKLDVFSGNDEVSATLINGQPNRAVQFFNDEQNVDLTVPDTFDAAGQAKITIKGTDKRANEPFSIKGLALGKTVDLKDAIGSHTLQYHIYKPVLIDSVVSGGTNVKSELNGVRFNQSLPKLDDSDATLDYGTEYTFNVNNLLPNSKLAVEATNGAKVSLKSEQANDKGEATFVLHDITDTSVKELAVTLKYHQTSSEKAILDEVYNLKLFNYSSTLKLELDKAQIVNNDEVHGVLSGGKPGEEIAWSVSGATEIVSSDAKFDEQGNAKVTVKGNPVDHDGVADVQDASVTATAMSLAPISKAFKVALTQYHAEFKQGPKSSYPNYPITNSGLTSNIDDVTLDYKTAYNNAQLLLQNVLPNSKAEVISSTNDLVSIVGDGADANGVIKFNIAPNNDFSLKQLKFKIRYYATEVGTKESDVFTLNMIPYSFKLTASPDKSTLTGYEKVTMTLSGGKPGEEVTWKNNQKIVIVSQENNSKFDNNGNSIIVIAGAPSENDGNPVSETGSIAAVAMGQNELRKEFSVVTNGYTMSVQSAPSFSYPNTVSSTSNLDVAEIDYKRTYNSGVVLTGMAANRPVQIVDVQAVSNSRAANNGSDLVVATTRKTTASGDLALNIKPVSDYNVKKIRFRVRYPSTETGFKTSDYITIPLHQYSLAIASDKSEIVGNGASSVTVSGGKPGEAVSVAINNKLLGTVPTKFDNSGNATFTVIGNPTNNGQAVTETGTITAQATSATNSSSKSITVKTNQFYCNFSQGPSFAYPATVATTTTEASTQMDYKRTYTNGLVLKDMAPNRPISIASQQLIKADNSRVNWNGVSLASATTAADKTAKLNLAQVTDYQYKKVAIKVNYPSTEIGTLTSKEFIIPLHQYSLAIASDKSEIVGDETAKITVSGGRPGETVSWSNTGSGTILSAGKSTTFDAQGNAYATVQGTAPFTDTVKTSVSTFSANLNNKIQLVNIYTIKGNNVAECHVFELVEIWKLLYTLNISVKSKDVEKAYITATLTAEGDDEFIFKLNNSYNMSLPSNAGSCKTCSACGDYTNFYKNSTKTFDVTQYLQDTNSIYVYFHNFTGGYSYKISNLEFTIKTYSKL